MINKTPSTIQKELTINDLMAIIKELKVKRIVKTEEDEKTFSIIVCGVFKIKKDKNKNKITLHKLVYKESWKWSPVNTIPFPLPIFYRQVNADATKLWIQEAIKHIIKNLLNNDFVFTGEISVILSNKNIVTGSYINNYPIFMDKYEIKHKLKKLEKRKFTLDKAGMHISNYGKVKYHYNKLDHQPIELSIIQRMPYIKDNDYSNARKSFNLAIRKAIDPKTLSNYININCYSFSQECYADAILTTHSIFDITVERYLNFSNSPLSKIDTSLVPLAPLLRFSSSPALQLIKENQNPQYFSKTKIISKLINVPELSIGDLKYLRHSPKAYRCFIAGLIDHHRNDNHYIHSSLSLAMKIFRLNELKYYPVNVILRIASNAQTILIRLGYVNSEITNHHINHMMMIISRWLEYHIKLYKNIGYKKNARRWNMEINYLHHALDWLNAENVILRKNQMWPSFHRLAEEWTTRQNHDDYYEPKIPEKWNGLEIDWHATQSLLNNLRIKEIVTFTDLKNEGNEMEHCVTSYAPWCASERYRVFSLYLGEERATLGITLIQDSMKFLFDQIRGKNNSPVSTSMEKAGRKILKLVNQHLSKK